MRLLSGGRAGCGLDRGHRACNWCRRKRPSLRIAESPSRSAPIGSPPFSVMDGRLPLVTAPDLHGAGRAMLVEAGEAPALPCTSCRRANTHAAEAASAAE